MFKSGGKMNLQMMCLGHHWEPTTNKYIHRRLIDGIEPPDIPVEFKRLIKKAIKDSHDLIKEELDVSNVHKILPLMDPDICVINFYTESGSLGLHQDKSESWDSVKKGLPVVSVSIGDSAEFLYGDTRDISGLKKIILESGDVVIFGGESRNVFHGVPSIFPNSAPRFLAYEANLCPGRLNLTFREY
ncbi:hypothetical protein GIB67_040397 [Kingdonia uniflora]|uniref:Fe2OG dioxygenase domain-containing protein n=1 Tax=Kingdonia uniflora TaxID=39325 RepID=A0A7J7KXK9_9MAGN|nr:hypothetical protein GIB67_040397 [Kingdonia uniflora]